MPRRRPRPSPNRPPNFGILAGLGLRFRHRPEVHKRLMLLALGPLAVARPGASHFAWVPILLIVETFGLIALVVPTAAWHRLAMWLAS